MNDLVIDRQTRPAGKFLSVRFISQKGALRAVMADTRFRERINRACRYTGLNKLPDFLQDEARNRTCRPHGFEIAFALEDDHWTCRNPLGIESQLENLPRILPFFKKPS